MPNRIIIAIIWVRYMVINWTYFSRIAVCIPTPILLSAIFIPFKWPRKAYHPELRQTYSSSVIHLSFASGQLERYSPIRKLYYKDASACVIIFDVTQYKTFDSAIKWRKNVETLSNVSSLPCLLLANKV